MGIKRLEDFNHDVEVAKEVLSSMPINNAKNLTLYLKKVDELKDEDSEYRKELFKEIKERSSKYLNMKPSDRTELVKKELLDYKDLGLFNPMNTPYEKMGFDTLFYSLIHYYKNDLVSVNNDIKEALSKFELAGITLTENDFVYSNYARRYIKELLKDDDIERMKDVFEDLHWKCPEVISHIETSFRILFNKNIKKFEKYIDDRKKEILIDNLSYEDYILRRTNLAKELHELENYEEAVIVNKFMNGELLLNDYNIINVTKCYAKFLGDNCDVAKGKEKSAAFKNLLFNLEEYRGFLKYAYVLEDVKKKYAERTSHVGEAAKLNKEITALVDELTKLTNEINNGASKGFWFLKKKVDVEKHYLTINEKVKELDLKYDEYDKALVYERLNQYITDTSSVYDVFQFAFAFKGYLRACIKENEENVDIKVVKSTVKEFEEFLLNPNLSVLKNIKFNVDNDIAMIIMDHYKLLELDLQKEEVDSKDEIEALITCLNVIINNHYLEKYELSIEFILNLFESKKLIEMYK